MNKLIIAAITMAIFLIAPLVYAEQGHMKLLAVREVENGTYEGGIADLYLEIKPGSGRVFLETFPLTRTDTQMSTRFAKAIACDMIENDCDDVDFFYTITADSAIIAGPSAGSSIAVLTASMLENRKIDEDIAITGTINSGGLIGPVGGLKAKIEAAKFAGLKKVLIPAGEAVAKIGNETVDLNELSKEIGIEIVEVSTLSEAVKEFTGREIKQDFGEIEITEYYADTMKLLASSLCARSKNLSILSSKYNESAGSNAKNLTLKGEAAFLQGKHYSAASFCFGANVEYTSLIYKNEKNSPSVISKEAVRLKSEISRFSSEIEKKEKKTITDLEAYIVVKERLVEAEQSVDEALSGLNGTNNSERAARSLAYGAERLTSAYSWAKFFGSPGKNFNLDEDILKSSCQNKLNEVSERKQYVELYLPGALSNVNKQIERATSELRSGNFELCLSQASKAKADVDIILSVFGVEESQYSSLAQRKLEVVRNNIARQASKGIFPILGYSYYEYANSLKETDVLSAMLYSEYALELGNLDIYFKESSISQKKSPEIDKNKVGIFLAGVITGMLALVLIRPYAKRR